MRTIERNQLLQQLFPYKVAKNSIGQRRGLRAVETRRDRRAPNVKSDLGVADRLQMELVLDVRLSVFSGAEICGAPATL